jgi:hypothetical protein
VFESFALRAEGKDAGLRSRANAVANPLMVRSSKIRGLFLKP